MSAIGDYVHFHKRNYKIWGTSKVNRKVSSANIEAIPRGDYFNAAKIQSLAAEARFLEEQYNKLFYPSKNDINDNEFKKQLEDIIQKKLDEEFGIVAGKFNADNLSVDNTELYLELNRAIQETKSRLGIAQVNKNTTVRNLLKQTELIYNILNQQEFKNIAEIQSRIEEAKGQLNNIKINLQNEIDTYGGTTKISNIQDVQTLENIIKEFNRVPALYKQNRAVFEWLVPFIQIHSASIAEEDLANTIKSLASDKIKVEIDPNKVNRSDININVDNINISTSSSKKSNEILISYQDDQDLFQQKKVIARNIKSSTKIQLLNSTSLYKLLTLSNTYNFANHYLNIVASAPGQTSPESDILQANRLLKSSILSVAIEKYDSNNVSFLIINNYSKKKISVYSIKLLLYIIQDNLAYGNNKYSNVITLEDDYTISNDFQDTVGHRISNILKTTRDKRISGSINASMLNAYKGALSTGKT